MRRHKWGIFWLAMLAINSANFSKDILWGRGWFALVAFAAAVLCAVMAYRDLTKPRVGLMTTTITIDHLDFDAAMKRAANSRSHGRDAR